MTIKGLVEEDFSNYKKPSMFIIFPYCSFKCDTEAGCTVCQNSTLANEPNIDISIIEIFYKADYLEMFMSYSKKKCLLLVKEVTIQGDLYNK